MPSFKLDHSKQFPTLPQAPIVEALLHWQAAASVELEATTLQQQLVTTFADYHVSTQQNFETALSGSAKGMQLSHSANWDGFRLTKVNNEKPVFVCQFKPSGLVFSRLAPYEGWEAFSREALRFWRAFYDIANPAEIVRLSTRYISQIPIKSVADIEEYLEFVPRPVPNLSSDAFYYQDSASLDDEPYTVHVVQAVQPRQPQGTKDKVLIVDIGASTSDGISDFGKLDERLSDLRFIKNEIFFSLMKEAEKKFGANK